MLSKITAGLFALCLLFGGTVGIAQLCNAKSAFAATTATHIEHVIR